MTEDEAARIDVNAVLSFLAARHGGDFRDYRRNLMLPPDIAEHFELFPGVPPRLRVHRFVGGP